MSEVMRGKATGKKSVVMMNVEVLVEVNESDNYYDMVEEAENKLDKHIIASTGFFPFRKAVNMIQDNTTVNELIQKITVQPGTGWYDR